MKKHQAQNHSTAIILPNGKILISAPPPIDSTRISKEHSTVALLPDGRFIVFTDKGCKVMRKLKND